ncbi:hypothetical protein KDZ21_03460 [Lactobacillus crispatus]|uniref:hypothetical protein n=1 Tax=Lactobacillus crispatus TaxID=47770 RepID=UPI001C4E1038|nr:hypothetical protein [Lactobacillus crispatus]MBW0437295.1 hypothetical protein [Lactobacillus crispatus]MBW0443658.1 hypothetical protein [Lactobacillus crispatus]MBW0455892.1 hypothetical protein [Lactobacillus crispatus]
MRQLLQRLNNNSLYVIISLLIFGKGLGFCLNRKFFFYPPQFAWLMNNVFLDYSMMIAGIGLLVYVCLPSNNNFVLGVLLAIITVLLAIITCIEIEHVIFAGEIEFVQNAISNSAIIGFILWTARHYSKR